MKIHLLNKSMKWLLVLTLIAVVLGVSFFYFKKPKESVSTVEVVKGSIVEKAEAVGNIKTREFRMVKSQVDGIVEAIYHEEGDYVTKDMPLIKIKPVPKPAEYAEAHKNLINDGTAENHAKTNLERQEYLIKSGILAKNDQGYINAKKDYDSAKAQKILSEQKLALLTKGETTVDGKPIANVVNIPIDGYLLYRSVNVGDPVISLSSSQSATPLFIVANMQELIFQGTVDERDVSKLKVGMDAKVKVGSLPDHQLTGVISRIALQSDKENKNQTSSTATSSQSDSSSPFNVGFRIEIANLKIPKDLVLRSGYSATATIELNKLEDILVLPMHVIQFKDDKSYVLLPAKNSREKPKEQQIKLGISDDINVEIKGGVKLGDHVLEDQDPSVAKNK